MERGGSEAEMDLQEEIVKSPLVVRIRLPLPWTPEEDSRLQRLAKENGFRRWSLVSRGMPLRSARSCRSRWRHHLARDVYHRPFTARDDDELLRLHCRLGDRWKDIGRAFYGRTSRVMRQRWMELCGSGVLPAAPSKKRPAGYPPPDENDTEDMDGGAESETSPPPRKSQRRLADVLASNFASCSFACDDAMDPVDGGLSLGFASMAV